MADEGQIGGLGTWALAVGGMVGGGIFAVLGVVVSQAGEWFWASLLTAGILAFVTSRSYVALAVRFQEGGGAFTYLRDLQFAGLAGGLGWMLLLGYTLTIALYASTFGAYLSYAVGAGGLLERVAAVTLVAAIVALNLRGTGSSTTLEIAAVLGELVILGGLVVAGLTVFTPAAMSAGVAPPTVGGVAIASAAVFVAYEGFQLTTYDWDELRTPSVTLPRAVPAAVGVVVLTYLLVAVAAVSILSAGGVAREGEIALAAAAHTRAGIAGLVAMTVAALLATGSAVNSTLFSTARLAERIARDGELPAIVEDGPDVSSPRRPLLVLGTAAAVLAGIGALSTIVEAASLTFLVTFALVNLIAARQLAGPRPLAWVGTVGCGLATAGLTLRLVTRAPIALGGIAVVAALAFVAREPILARVRTDG